MCLVLALVFTASAGAKTDPQVLALRSQVSGLRHQVTALQQQVKILNSAVSNLTVQLAYEKNMDTCRYALGQDSFRIVFTTLSKMAGVLTGSNVPPWETIPRFDDAGACAAVGVSRP